MQFIKGIGTVGVLIVLFIVFLILMMVFRKWWQKRQQKAEDEPVLLCPISNASDKVKIDAATLRYSRKNTGVQFTLSTWIYISDWNMVANNKNRQIVRWMDKTGGLNLSIDSMKNSIHCSWKSKYISAKNRGSNDYFNSMTVDNIPLQKWLNVVVILDGRYLDLFINGKLYKSKLLDVPPTIAQRKMDLCPSGGFPGFISNVKYFNRALNHAEVIALFKQGYKCGGGVDLKKMVPKVKLSVDVEMDVS